MLLKLVSKLCTWRVNETSMEGHLIRRRYSKQLAETWDGSHNRSINVSVSHHPAFCAVPIYTAAESKNSLYRCWFARSNQLGLHRTCYYCRRKDVRLSVTSRAICRLVPPANHHPAEFTPGIIRGAKLQWKPLPCYHDMSLPVCGLSPSILDWAFREGCSGFGLMLLGTVMWRRAERYHKHSCVFHSFFFWPLLPTHWHSDCQWHTHTHSVGFLWASDRPFAETATWHHTTLTDKHPCPRRDSNPQSQHSSGLRPTPWTARPPVSFVHFFIP
jgi:hypothetical protein